MTAGEGRDAPPVFWPGKGVFSGAFREILRARQVRAMVHDGRRQWQAAVRHNGYSVVTRGVMRDIKRYARSRFGFSGHWPWLAYYAELRGEFVPGWLAESYLHRVLVPRWNPQPFRISSRKSLDQRIFNELAAPLLVARHHGYWLSGEGCPLTLAEARAEMAGHDVVVMKPDTGSGGQGVRFLTPARLFDCLDELPKRFVVQTRLLQHPDMGRPHPASLNTLRVKTFHDVKRDEIRVLDCLMRVGDRNSPVDNASSGGLMLFLDERGRGRGFGVRKGGLERHVSHPTSGMPFNEVRVPGFDRVKAVCLEAHARYPYLQLIGWDIAIRQDGRPVIIEWNSDHIAWSMGEVFNGPLIPESRSACKGRRLRCLLQQP